MYVTDGASKIACSEGSNIAQPPGSPGWVDDPTGSVQGSSSHAVSLSLKCQLGICSAGRCQIYPTNGMAKSPGA